jgi:hypothetical protein
MFERIRKYTPFMFGRNMSGKKALVSFSPIWLPSIYIGPIYFGINLHINRFRQILKSIKARGK